MAIKDVTRRPHEHVNLLPVQRALVADFRVSIYYGKHLKTMREVPAKLYDVPLTFGFAIHRWE